MRRATAKMTASLRLRDRHIGDVGRDTVSRVTMIESSDFRNARMLRHWKDAGAGAGGMGRAAGHGFSCHDESIGAREGEF